MNQKHLWKIESLWEKYYHSNQFKQKSRNIFQNISSLYNKKDISKHNPNFKRVKYFNPKKSQKPVHHDGYGRYLGLEYSQVLEKNGKIIYIFDNHNKILQPFLEYFEITGKSFDVVHIDAHADDAVFPAEKPHCLILENITNYIEQTRISDFFDFTLRWSLRGMKQSQKIINTIHRYTQSSDFRSFHVPEKPYILSLDIDIFGPEGDFTDSESKIKTIAEAWQLADMVCIATSPGFIDQSYATDLIHILTENPLHPPKKSL